MLRPMLAAAWITAVATAILAAIAIVLSALLTFREQPKDAAARGRPAARFARRPCVRELRGRLARRAGSTAAWFGPARPTRSALRGPVTLNVQVTGPLTWDNDHMDPYVRMIWQRAAILGLAAGALVALLYGLSQLAELRHALTLNMAPPGLTA